MKVGVRGGVNTGNYSFESITVGDYGFAPAPSKGVGWQAGVVLRLSIPAFVHIQPEFNVVSRDYRLLLTSGSVTRNVNCRVRSFELPVALGFKIGALRLFGGPVFKLDSRQSVEPKGTNFALKYVDHADVALMLGVGVESKKLFFDARYLTYTGDVSAELSYAGGKLKRTVKTDELWQFSAGFFF